ncbi:SDR family oxidoreductase [Priestia flexa]|uniref:SDR family oxidoreductase n=1 Tax=Priestia flexa TaxID=86664 RepID=UPI00209FE4FC|nr:SDR family oxidoreductase [Priestia flexa]MCP1188727.1 SDR family oxidoreductase [Priestia flexa]
MELNLKEKTALVFAASQGLGKAIATQFAKEGANVVIASRSEDKLQRVVSELNKIELHNVRYIKADVASLQDIEQAVRFTEEEFGTIDILVNNAGGPKAGNFLEMTDEDWYTAFENNLMSCIRMTRTVVPIMKKSGGKIINIASSSIKEPIPGLVLSNTFRTGIVGLTKTLAEELAAYGILINTVAPGRIATDRVGELDSIRANKLGITKEEIQTEMASQIALGRYGNPEEFAKVVTFVASGANSYMTGQSFLVDGGLVKSI